MALRFSGRLKRTSQMPPACVTSTGSLMQAACGSAELHATRGRTLAREPSVRWTRTTGCSPRAEIHVAVGGEPHERRPGRDVLVERRAVHLVEGVIGRVVDVEIAHAVLAQLKCRHAGLYCRADVGARVGRGPLRGQYTDRGEQTQQRLFELAVRRGGRQGERVHTISAKVAFPGEYVARQLGLVVGGIRVAAES